MSIILRALKRLETEPSNSDKLPSMSRQTRSQWFAGRTRRRVRILWLLIIVLLLSVSAGGFFWNRIPNIANLFDSSTGNNKIVKKITPATPKQPNKAVATKSVSKTPPPLRKRRPVVTTQKRSPVPAKTPIEATQQPAPLPVVQAPRKPANRRPSPEFLPPKERPSPGSEAKSSPPNLADSSYTLQAIAWSKNSNERLAVINGQVLREGDGIEGITVTQIGTNEVIVQKESKLWKLVFQAR
jgi:outer membrane biosynthesis protein TonB